MLPRTVAGAKRRRPARPPRASLATAAVLVLGGCASIPRTRYAVDALELHGVERMDEHALRACLATHERPGFVIDFGHTSSPDCGLPPFDGSRLRLSLWAWPWTEWPLYDRSVFERDLERIERWYRARGFYDARVTSARAEPTEAWATDHVPDVDPPCERAAENEGCTVRLAVRVEEGEPVRVTEVSLAGLEGLSPSLARQLRDNFPLGPGARFDEAEYDRGKARLRRVLADASFAHARVSGEVEVDPIAHAAIIRLTVEPGPACRFGGVRIDGAGELPTSPIRGAALLVRGRPYSERALEEARRAVYALGAFSTVEVTPVLDARDRAPNRVVDVVVRVAPGRLTRLGLGAGLQAGDFGFENELLQWDFHLLGVAEHRNFLGGLRRLRAEWRPKLVFDDVFVSWWSGLFRWAFSSGEPPAEPRVGSDVRLEFRQPAFLEARTSLVFGARWDYGPDAFLARESVLDAVIRHDLDAQLGPERHFLSGRLLLALHLRTNVLLVDPEDRARDPEITSDHHVVLLEPVAQLDLRNDARSPRRGGLVLVGAQGAGYLVPSSWDYLRLTGDVRGYLPMPWRLVLAGRFALGAMLVSRADASLDPTSAALGPLRYRLRGGGASSNRGFLPAQLGDSFDGGLRRWEASLELRAPITGSWSIALFADLGDVHARPRFRFDYAHTSLGAGIRYQTPIGPARLDVGWRVPGAQVLGADDAVEARTSATAADLLFIRFPGAVHLTVGESF